MIQITTDPAQKKEWATSPLLLLIIGTSITFIDVASSTWLANYSGLPLVEANAVNVDESGRFIDESKIIAMAVFRCVALALLASLYSKSRKPEKACYTSLKQIHKNKEYRVFRWSHSGMYVIIYVGFYVVFVHNMHVVMAALIGSPSIRFYPFGALLCAAFVYLLYCYTYYATIWRYLTDEAKKKHPYFEWPYEKGLLKQENLKLT